MIGAKIAWNDNWYHWNATISGESGNCYLLSDVIGTARMSNGKVHVVHDLQYTGRNKGNVLLKAMVEDAERVTVIR